MFFTSQKDFLICGRSNINMWYRLFTFTKTNQCPWLWNKFLCLRGLQFHMIKESKHVFSYSFLSFVGRSGYNFIFSISVQLPFFITNPLPLLSFPFSLILLQHSSQTAFLWWLKCTYYINIWFLPYLHMHNKSLSIEFVCGVMCHALWTHWLAMW